MVKSQENENVDLELVWNKKVPDAELEKFKSVIENKYKIRFDSYWDLHKWSTDNFQEFWHEIWQYFQIISSNPYEKVFEKTGSGFLDNTWFKGAKMNYAENLLKIRDDTVAINYVDTEGNKESVTYSELYDQVCLYAAAFKKNGLRKGDRVASYMSNRIEAIVAMLATVSVGAIWSGAHPLYGPKAAKKIMERIEPKFIIAVDRFMWEEEIDIINALPTIIEGISSIEKVIIIPTQRDISEIDLSTIKKGCFLHDFLQSGKTSEGRIPEIQFEQVSPDYPVFLCFTSGTTGTPKGVIHSGRVLLPMITVLAFHSNLKKGDALFSHYAVGWILWNLFLNCLALGVRLVLHEGYPLCKDEERNYWNRLAEYEVTFLVVVPSLIERAKQFGILPSPKSNFTKLKMIGIGGSSVKVENIRFIQNHISKDVAVTSLYGSTENFGYITGFDWNIPSYSTETQVPALGIDLRCMDFNGKSLIGTRGEVVIATPTPSLPSGLWRDDNKEVLIKNYLSKYPGFWCMNDECWINPKTKGMVLHGRSDDTITQNGERFLPNDIYQAIQDIEELADYVCVPQKRDDDDRAVLFLKLKSGQSFTETLKEKIKNKIKEELWMDLIPKVILPISDIPYNVNGKRMESLVKKIIATNSIPDNSNIKNPECLPHFCNIPEIVNYNKD